jgi:hypothetical protein
MKTITGIVVGLFFFITMAPGHGSAQAQANLRVTSYSSSYSGSTAYYFVAFINDGPDATESLSMGASTGLTSITSAYPSQGSCTISGNGITCDPGTLECGATLYLTVQGQLPSFGAPHPRIFFCGFSAGVSASNDPDTSNNSQTICMWIEAVGSCQVHNATCG